MRNLLFCLMLLSNRHACMRCTWSASVLLFCTVSSAVWMVHTLSVASRIQQGNCSAQPGQHSPIQGSCSPVYRPKLLCTCIVHAYITNSICEVLLGCFCVSFSGFISENLTRGANGTYTKSWGGNMKTLVAVDEEQHFQ